MLNMARADFYRLWHSKGFYITQIALILLILISILTNSVGVIAGGDENLYAFQAAQNKLTWTAVRSIQVMSSMTSALIYFLLPLFIMTIGFEFSRKIYKNPLSSGMSRLNYFISKYCVFILITFCQFIFMYVTIFLAAGFKNGFGHPSSHMFGKMSATIGMQFLMMVTIFSISVLIMYLTFSTITAVIVTIIFPIIMTILVQLFPKQHWLIYFNFQNKIDAAYITHFSGQVFTHTLETAFATILICLVISFITFNHKDL